MDDDPSRRNTGRRILIVEDSDDLRELMVLLLEAEGYLVDTAATASDALDQLDRTSYDLVLTDYALPGRSGAWLLTEAVARRRMPFGCALIVTAHPNPSDTNGFEVIRKPLEFDSFLARVRDLLEACRQPSPVRRRPPRGSPS
jgi:DNA-binding response OmpR family regulator